MIMTITKVEYELVKDGDTHYRRHPGGTWEMYSRLFSKWIIATDSLAKEMEARYQEEKERYG